MQLEKATSRSSEAALAGWISSNDATLFTMVLVVVIAIFLYSNLHARAKENLQIAEDRQTLSERLQSTADELDASKNQLTQTIASLELTQQQRDQLQKQLVEKLEDLSRLNTRLAALLNEKDKLVLERQSLSEAKESLSRERQALLTQKASLARDLETSSAANLSLQQRLESISTQLVEKLDALEQLDDERDRLRRQVDQLSAIVAGLKQRLQKVNIDLAETRERADEDRGDSERRVRELEAQLAAGNKKADDYLAELQRATALFQGLKAEKEQLQSQLTEAEQKRQADLLEEGKNNRELVGLKGKLERVAIVFDASGSMRLASVRGAGDRWDEAQRMAATWLQHLNVQQCVLVVFSSDVKTFPQDGSLADLRGDNGKANRQSLLQHLKAVKPGGWTNTYDALRKAYQYDIDAVLLFSDGAPSKDPSGVFDPELAEQIYKLCREHQTSPIHTVGVGNYFDTDMSTFLLSIARITGGTFRGQ